jgi:DNA repair protein RadC
MKMKEVPAIERPREKLIHYGPEKLSTTELLAILLRSGKRGENVVELAHKILKKYGTDKLAHLTFHDLQGYNGLGPAKACEIVACFELGKRLLKDKKAELYLKPEDVFDRLKDIREHKKEHFIILFLDTRNQEIKKDIISIGSLNASLVHPREVFEPAVRNTAAQLIIAHNHPSGDTNPSTEDIHITQRLVEAGKIMGIEVTDHVIISRNGYFSFKEKGLL